MDDIRERLEDEKKTVEAAGGKHPFDPNRPWDLVWHIAAEESEKFWKDEFETPAQMVKMRLRKLRDEVDGDAEVEEKMADHEDTPASASIARTSGPKPWQMVPPPPPPVREPARAKRTAEEPEIHEVNMKGHPLCDGFQDGSCADSLPGGCVCAVDKKSRHQCALCLSLKHGAAECPKNKNKRRKGKGRGKGGRGGRGGGRGGRAPWKGQ